MKEVTLSPQGENSLFRKIVTLLKLLFCEIYFNTVYEIRGAQNLWWYTNLWCLNVFSWHERGHAVTAGWGSGELSPLKFLRFDHYLNIFDVLIDVRITKDSKVTMVDLHENAKGNINMSAREEAKVSKYTHRWNVPAGDFPLVEEGDFCPRILQ